MIAAAFYGRKSNDEGDKAAEAKSIAVQQDLAERFAAARGWTIDPKHIFTDDGVSGAIAPDARPGFSKLLAALTTKPAPFKHVIVVEQSRLGRDTASMIKALDQIEKASASVWSTRDDRQITLEDDFHELFTLLNVWRDKSERKKTIVRVKDNAAKRFASGHVVSNVPYSYQKSERVAGSKAALTLVVNEEQAAVVRRIFDLCAKGLGLHRITKQMNAEGVPGPRAGEAVVTLRRP
jgi:site-specific DNA recombinase